MAEPFSAVAAGITLVGTVLRLSKTVMEFGARIQGAPQSVSALSTDITSLTGVLITLENFLQGLDGRRQHNQVLITQLLRGPLFNCQHVLQDIESSLIPFIKSPKGLIRSKWKGLRWAYRERDILAVQRRLSYYQQLLNSAIAVVHLYFLLIASLTSLADLRKARYHQMDSSLRDVKCKA